MPVARHHNQAFQDPFLAELCAMAESMILAADKHARSLGMTLTDSNIRSAVIKAQAITAGESPKFPEGRPRDAIVRMLAQSLSEMRDDLASVPVEARPEHEKAGDDVRDISAADWHTALGGIEQSIEIRKSPVPGSRDYLEYLELFLKDFPSRVRFPRDDGASQP